MPDKPLVSIVIPSYNNRDYLPLCLASCFQQTYPNLEVIVVDDGSSDGTQALISDLYGDKLQYLYQQNGGPAAARNRGIQAAKGEFIKFCDADDQLFPTHIERLMAVFAAAPEDVAVVYSRYLHVAEDGQTPLAELTDPPLLTGKIFCDLLKSNGNAILTSASIVKRAACLAVGCFDESEAIRGVEDWDFYLKLAAHYDYRSVNEILLYYRRHAAGLTANPYRMTLGRLRTVQNMRASGLYQHCMSQAEIEALEAGRHHTLAMLLWEQGKPQEARQHLGTALTLSPQAGLLRRLYYAMSYFAPYHWTTVLNNLLEKRH